MKMKDKSFAIVSALAAFLLTTSCSALYTSLRAYNGGEVETKRIEKKNGEVVEIKTVTKSDSSTEKYITVKLPNGTVDSYIQITTVEESGEKLVVTESSRKASDGNVLYTSKSTKTIDADNNGTEEKTASINYGTPNLKESSTGTSKTLDLSDSEAISALNAKYSGVSEKIAACGDETVFIEETNTVITDSFDTPYAVRDSLVITYSDGSKDIITQQSNVSGASYRIDGSYGADGFGGETKRYFDDTQALSKIEVTDISFDGTVNLVTKTFSEYNSAYVLQKTTTSSEYIEPSEEPVYDLNGKVISDDVKYFGIIEDGVEGYTCKDVSFENKPFEMNYTVRTVNAGVTTEEYFEGNTKAGSLENGDVVWLSDKTRAYIETTTVSGTSAGVKTEDSLRIEYKSQDNKAKETHSIEKIYSDKRTLEVSIIDYVENPNVETISEDLWDASDNLLENCETVLTKDSGGALLKTEKTLTVYTNTGRSVQYTVQDGTGKYLKALKSIYDAVDNLIEVQGGGVFTATIQSDAAGEDISVEVTENNGSYVFTVPAKYSGITWTWLGESLSGTANGNTYTLDSSALVNGVYSLYIEDSNNHSVQINITINR